MVSTAVVVPVATWMHGFPAGFAGMVSVVPVIALMAYYGFIGLGMWLVRPRPGHRLAFRISMGYLHLLGACCLLMWSHAFTGARPDVFRPRTAFSLAATALQVFACVPAFVLLKRARDAKPLFVVLLIVPFGVAVALLIVLMAFVSLALRGRL
jgi:hypothetical protein